jgi:hypothetical protein
MDVDRDFSSSATFLYKFIFPPIWIALCGLLVFQYSHLSHPIGPFGHEAVLAFVLLTVVGSVFFLRFSLPLLRVQLRDGHLYASNYFGEIEIRPSDIADVTQNVWVKLRPITIRLRTPSEFGQRLSFMPPMRIIFRFWIQDPIVEELRAFARHPEVDPWAVQ